MTQHDEDLNLWMRAAGVSLPPREHDIEYDQKYWDEVDSVLDRCREFIDEQLVCMSSEALELLTTGWDEDNPASVVALAELELDQRDDNNDHPEA